MHITKNTVVTMTFKVTDAQGKLLEDGKEPRAYLHGGYGNTLPRVEAELEGKAAGFQTTLTLAPEDAFGPRDENLVTTMPKKDFPPGIKVGGEIKGYDASGHEQWFIVKKINGDTVHLDGNHAYAGQTLKFSLKVMSVREASPEEVAHGHAHGAHGHHH